MCAYIQHPATGAARPREVGPRRCIAAPPPWPGRAVSVQLYISTLCVLGEAHIHTGGGRRLTVCSPRPSFWWLFMVLLLLCRLLVSRSLCASQSRVAARGEVTGCIGLRVWEVRAWSGLVLGSWFRCVGFAVSEVVFLHLVGGAVGQTAQSCGQVTAPFECASRSGPEHIGEKKPVDSEAHKVQSASWSHVGTAAKWRTCAATGTSDARSRAPQKSAVVRASPGFRDAPASGRKPTGYAPGGTGRSNGRARQQRSDSPLKKTSCQASQVERPWVTMKFLGPPASGSQAGTTSSHNRFGQYRQWS